MKHIKISQRSKGIVIPHIGNKYVLIKDKKSGDASFIGGGCKRYEHIASCALRELNEETRNVFNFVKAKELTQVGQFVSYERSRKEREADKKQCVKVEMRYHIFHLDLGLYGLTESDVKTLLQTFYLKNTLNNETSGIMLLSKREILDPKTKLWKFMKENVIQYIT